MSALHLESRAGQPFHSSRDFFASGRFSDNRAAGSFAFIGELIERMSVRRRLAAGTLLFEAGDLASSYYLVESGVLRVRGSGGPARRLEAGSLFIYECEHVHVADCAAAVDSTVHCIDRGRLERLAERRSEIKGALHLVHSDELAMIAQCLGYRRSMARACT